MTDYDQNDFNMPRRPEIIEESNLLKKNANPESKHTINFDFRKLDICSPTHYFTYTPKNRVTESKKE